MAVQIPKGQTRQADLLETFTTSSQPAGWQINGGPPSAFPQGWSLTSTGVLTIPASTPLALGYRTAVYIDAGNGTESTARRYEFEMVEAPPPTPECDFTISVNVDSTVLGAQIGQPHSHAITAVASRTVGGVTTFLEKNLQVVVTWGDGGTDTYSVTTNTLGTGAPTNASHTYAARGNYTITATATVADGSCTGSGGGSSSIQAINNRYHCTNGSCQPVDTPDNSGYATLGECQATGCGFTGTGWYCVGSSGNQTPTFISDGASWAAAGSPSPKYNSEYECPCYTPPVYWCVDNTIQSGPTAPNGVTSYESYQACYDAGCHVVVPPTVFWCAGGEIQTGTNPPANVTIFETYQACYDAGCHMPDPTQFYWCVNGNVVLSASSPAEGATGPFLTSPDCSELTEPPETCTYFPYALLVEHENDVINGDHLLLSLHAQGDVGSGGTMGWSNGWTITLHHTVNDQARPNITPSGSIFPYLHWNIPFEVGVHHFEAEYTKGSCDVHIAEANFSAGGTTDHGDDCPPAFEGDKWYCVDGTPTHIETFEEWVAANKPTPGYASKQNTPCFIAAPPCANTLAWDFPSAGATIKGLDFVTVHSVGPSPLATNNPVSILFNGTPLFVQPSPGDDSQFVARIPASLGEWQGTIHLSAQLKHESGCLSPVITRDVLVNGTLLDDTRWGDVLLTQPGVFEAVQADLSFDPPTLTDDYFYEARVSSPPPGDSPPPANPSSSDQLSLEQTWSLLQNCLNNTDTPLLGLRGTDGEYTPPTNEAICRIRASRAWKRIKYALGAPLTKIRPTTNSDGSEAIFFYALPFIYKLDESGFKLLRDLTSAQTLIGKTLVDASILGPKINVVAGSGSNNVFVALDLDSPDAKGNQISQLSQPLGAVGTIRFTETLSPDSNGLQTFVRLYSDGTTTELWESWHTPSGPEERKGFFITAEVQKVTIRDKTVACVVRNSDGSEAIITWTSGDTDWEFRAASGESPITFLSIENEDGDIAYGTQSGELRLVQGTYSELLTQSDDPVRGSTLYNAGEGDVRAFGGDSPSVWWQPEGVFIPLLNLDSDEEVDAMTRWEQTVIEGSGDPLLGGVPALGLDSLLVAVHSPGQDYILRYQKMTPGPFATRASGITDWVFSSTLQGAGESETV